MADGIDVGGVAVVTIVRGRDDHLRLQRRWLGRSGALHVVVAMGEADRTTAVVGDDPLRTLLVEVPTDPERLPLAAARNAGAGAAIGAGADTLVFLDVDCLPSAALVGRYAEVARQRPDALLSGPVGHLPPRPAGGYPGDEPSLHGIAVVSPARPVPPPGAVVAADRPELFWSLSFALSVAAWERTGGFCEEYEGYGAEDTDFALTADRRGVPLSWVGSAWAWHQDHGPSGAVAGHAADIVRNARIFHDRWGSWPMEGWLDRLVASGDVRRDGDGTPHLV